MASRYFFALCALALIAAVVAGPVADEVEVDLEEFELDNDSERVWPAFAAWAAGEGAAWLYKRFVHVKVKCFPDVIKSCDMSPFLHPQQYYRCADNYFQSHAERCLKKSKN